MENEYHLIEQIIKGNHELFEQIVLKYQNLIFTVCYKIIRSNHDAENMTQEVFLSAFRTLSSFRGEELKSWLCRIAVNKSIDFKRIQTKRLSRETPLELHESEIPSPNSVEFHIENKEIRDKLSNILSNLPEKYKSVINAFYFRQLPVKEIARLSSLPENTIETRLYRARKLLKKRWGNDDI